MHRQCLPLYEAQSQMRCTHTQSEQLVIATNNAWSTKVRERQAGVHSLACLLVSGIWSMITGCLCWFVSNVFFSVAIFSLILHYFNVLFAVSVYILTRNTRRLYAMALSTSYQKKPHIRDYQPTHTRHSVVSLVAFYGQNLLRTRTHLSNISILVLRMGFPCSRSRFDCTAFMRIGKIQRF